QSSADSAVVATSAIAPGWSGTSVKRRRVAIMDNYLYVSLRNVSGRSGQREDPGEGGQRGRLAPQDQRTQRHRARPGIDGGGDLFAGEPALRADYHQQRACGWQPHPVQGHRLVLPTDQRGNPSHQREEVVKRGGLVDLRDRDPAALLRRLDRDPLPALAALAGALDGQ